MAIAAVPTEPTPPFLRLNRFHVVRFSLEDEWGRSGYRRRFLNMEECCYNDGRFKEDAFIIDANCWKFPVHDVLNLGQSGNLLNRLFGRPQVRVRYVYDTPTQMTFEQARSEIVELICSKRWFSQTQDRESEKRFRERMGMVDNMRDLIVGRRNTDPKSYKRFQWIGGLSFYGNWVG